LPFGILFNTQAQINSFSTNYPGCTQILGSVHIEGPGITNLAGLSGVTAIGGYLNIKNNSALTGVSGLSALTTIGGFFLIDNNDALPN